MKYYMYKGHLYSVVREVRMKDSVNGWVDAIEYQRADNPTDESKHQMFIREQAAFNEKFAEVELENANISTKPLLR